jgi:hypothetical protein
MAGKPKHDDLWWAEIPNGYVARMVLFVLSSTPSKKPRIFYGQ